MKAGGELPRAAESIESPYDTEARFSQKRGTTWTGYKAHLSETCEDGQPHLITHVETTLAVVQDVSCTETIHAALIGKGLPPGEHLVDAGYVDAGLLVGSRGAGIDLVGPTRPNHSWQTQVEGAYEADRFLIDWEAQRVTCPQGKDSSAWTPQVDRHGNASLAVKFRPTDCSPCAARSLCTRAKRMPRTLKLHPREEHEALQAARQRLATEEGKRLYESRAGVEGTLSQGIRVSGLRHARYRGLSKVHLQHVATAAGMNLGRLAAWLMGAPQAATRVSGFAQLAPSG